MYKVSLSEVLSEDTIKELLSAGYHKTVCRRCGNQTFDHEFKCPHCGDIFEGCVNMAKFSEEKINIANFTRSYISVVTNNDTDSDKH